MGYSRDFYALNLSFANRVAQVAPMPLEQALLNYTNLYVRFGLGRNLDYTHAVWQEYLSGLDQSADAIEWTYQFSLAHAKHAFTEVGQPRFGCFSYSIWEGHRLRLHFHNNETADVSPLSEVRRYIRLAELKMMFTAIHQQEQGFCTVVGGSWLYHLEAYQRLFPPAYLATAKPGEGDYAYLTLWGQFLDRNGQLKPETVSTFTGCLQRQDSLFGVLNCFPLNVLYLEAPVDIFYQFYGVA